MQYYHLNYSLDSKVIGRGTYPQTKGVFTNVDNPNYIFNAFKRHTKVDKEVDIPFACLRQKSTKLTDMLSSSGSYGFESNLLISDRLKRILEESRQIGFQFFNTKVFDFKGEQEYSYWLSNTYIFFPEYVDYSKSELLTETSDGKDKEKIFCDSYEDYQGKSRLFAPRTIYLNKVVFLSNEIEYDFFALNNVYGGLNYYVSEKLKNEIEKNGCTGITFTAPDEIYP